VLEKIREKGSAGAVGQGADAEKLVEVHERLALLVERKRKELLAQLEEGEKRVVDSSSDLKGVRGEVEGIQRRHDELVEMIHGEDLERAELKIRVEQLVERIVDGYKVPLEYALEQYAGETLDPSLEEKVEEFSRELEHIGPVNPEAITEKAALEERYEFLQREVEDIQETKKRLRKVIKQVDREIKQRFKNTLDEVDRNFQEVFSFLFPNGKAELVLTDPDDLLDTGVEIMAQPEGKKLRRISLLSGGETSMTALAFLFALFRVRPSPFYFLDEVEAALDDINLHRFLELVKRFKGESQLILITHQKRSMEIADILVVNKADRPGAARTARALEMVIDRNTPADGNGWQPPILQTIALDGSGVDDLMNAINDHRRYLCTSGLLAERERRRIENELLSMIQRRLLERLMSEVGRETIEGWIERILAREKDVYTVASHLCNTQNAARSRRD